MKSRRNEVGKTPCSVSISYVQGRDSGRTVRLTIEDGISGCTVAEVVLSLEQWALALSSLGRRPGLMEFHPDNFGKVCETKEEIVPALPGWDKTKTRAAALKPFRVDGWFPRESDYGNHHRWFRREPGDEHGAYRVLFFRYVEPTPERLAERLAEIKKYEER